MLIFNTWFFVFILHLIFSTTFITTSLILILINSRIRQYFLICITWCLWLSFSFLFSLGRVMLGLYHIFRISINILFFVMSSLLLRLSLIIRSYFTRRDNLLYKLEYSDNYEEWFSIGNKLDLINGGYDWRKIDETEDYQWMYLKEYINRLSEARRTSNYRKIVFLLRWCCHRNFASISRQSLYNKAFSGTKILIDNFEEEIYNVLNYLRISLRNKSTLDELDLALNDSSIYNIINKKDILSNQNIELSSNSIDRIIKITKNVEENYDQYITDNDDIIEFENELIEKTSEYEAELKCNISEDSIKDCMNSCVTSSSGSVSVTYMNNEESVLSSSFTSSTDCKILTRDISVQTCGVCANDGEKGLKECSCIDKEYNNNNSFQNDTITKGMNKSECTNSEISVKNELDLGININEVAVSNSLVHFLELLGHSMGKTALCLSGGGALAMYHLGVVKVLIQQNIMPKIINGTSGGSIVAALLATKKNDEILNEYIKPTVSNMYGNRWFPPFLEQIRHFIVKGYMINPKDFTKTCQIYFKNYTFYEAYKLTGRIVTITVSPTHASPEYTEPLLLNCVTTPDVLIWSAVAASCALPGLMPVAELFAKESITNKIIRYFPPGMKWMDGSISQDIPHKELSTLFNVRQFIVSQVNPHHVPFITHDSFKTMFSHPERKLLNDVLNWLTLDIKYRYTKLAKLKLIPKLFGKDVSNFWMLQDIEGHVTITPKTSLFDWYRCINHPSYDDMLHFIREGERRTWPHVMRIKHMSFLERAIEDCIQSIKSDQKRTQNSLL
ncbi:hypothetical protein FG386_002407 [Cryptosporidium ryanae]|uniref:uncharacterized protein n=1 Tax=Cryptosporidium ryanae TaxID=515981 RepID=UPI00351A89F7|nr:hypothetical protein FG386_002407 [Cryptosporidium ryanae]